MENTGTLDTLSTAMVDAAHDSEGEAALNALCCDTRSDIEKVIDEAEDILAETTVRCHTRGNTD